MKISQFVAIDQKTFTTKCRTSLKRFYWYCTRCVRFTRLAPHKLQCTNYSDPIFSLLRDVCLRAGIEKLSYEHICLQAFVPVL